jgi:phosphoribosylformimino-5-aminoimidazole carboxamide ribotide isomerase
MKVIGVIDLRGGQAVHARQGVRDRYEPVQHGAAGPIAPGDATALAWSYVRTLGISELYAADLDAILGGAPNDAIVHTLAAIRPLWLDAGISSVEQAGRLHTLGADRLIVALETLPSFHALRAICDAFPGAVAFSLDLRNGVPLNAKAGRHATERPEDIAKRAADAGASSVIVIDLARVGSNAGIDLDVVRAVRTAVPGASLLAGGGIRGAEDLRDLADAGCDAVLVATALQDGRIGAADVAAVHHRSVTRQTAD